MAKVAKMREIKAPASGATARPTHLFCVRDAATPAPNAPARSWPSMAMLITPERSQTTPASAPKMSGTERINPP